jgi:hypothetical protein
MHTLPIAFQVPLPIRSPRLPLHIHIRRPSVRSLRGRVPADQRESKAIYEGINDSARAVRLTPSPLLTQN